MTHNEILRFCEFMRELVPDAVNVFTKGNCGLFAVLLEEKFPGGEIWTNIDHTFYKKDGGSYDITGLIEEPDGCVPLRSLSAYRIKQILTSNY